MTTITIDRAVVEQALDALEAMNPYPASKEDQRASALAALLAALVQQAKPDHETRAELAEQQVVQLAEERDHYRNLWQKAQQDEPVEPVAWWKQHHDGSVELNEARTFIAEDAIATGRRPLVFGDAALAQQAEPVQHYASIPGTNVRVRLQPEPASADPHTTTLRNLLECCLSWEPDACVLGNVTARQAITALRAALAQQDEPVAADALTEPKSGDKWRVEWWNESCRMMLPAHAKLDSFVAYKNGTIQFTIKRTAA